MRALVARSMTALEPWNRGVAGAGEPAAVVGWGWGGSESVLSGVLTALWAGLGAFPPVPALHAAVTSPSPNAAISNRRAFDTLIRPGIMGEA